MPGLVVFMHRRAVLLFAVLMLVGITSGVADPETTIFDAFAEELSPLKVQMGQVVENMLFKEDFESFIGNIMNELSSVITHQVFETAVKRDIEKVVTAHTFTKAMKDMHVKLDGLIIQSNTSTHHGVCSHAAFQPPNVDKKPLFVQDLAPLKQWYEAGTKQLRQLQQLVTAVNTSIAGAMDALHKTNAKQNQDLHETNAKQHENVMEKFNLTTVVEKFNLTTVSLELADIKSHVTDKHAKLEKIIAEKDIAIEARDKEITTLRVQIAKLQGRVNLLTTQPHKAQTDSSDETDSADAPSAGAIQDATQWIGAFISPFATQVKNLYSQSSNQTAPEEKPPVVTCRNIPLPYELIVVMVVMTFCMECACNTLKTSQCEKDKEDEEEQKAVTPQLSDTSRRRVFSTLHKNRISQVARKLLHQVWYDMPSLERCFLEWKAYHKRNVLNQLLNVAESVDEMPESLTELRAVHVHCIKKISRQLESLQEIVKDVHQKTLNTEAQFAQYLNNNDPKFRSMSVHIKAIKALRNNLQIWQNQRPMPESMAWAEQNLTVADYRRTKAMGVLSKFFWKRRWISTLIEKGKQECAWLMTPEREKKFRKCIYTLIGHGLLNKDGEYVPEEMTKVLTGLKTFWKTLETFCMKKYLTVKARRAPTRFFSTAYWSGSLLISDDQVQAAMKQAEVFRALADSSSGSEEEGVVELTHQLQAIDVSSNEDAVVR